MTSYVDEAVQARIAAVAAKKQQQRQERAEFARRRAAGLEARKAAKTDRVFCGTCAKPQRKGSYGRCPLGCGTALCRARMGCARTHLRQCDNRGDMSTVGEAS